MPAPTLAADADRGVAQIAQMVGLGARARAGCSWSRRNCRSWRPRRCPSPAAAGRTGRSRPRPRSSPARVAEAVDHGAGADPNARARSRRRARSPPRLRSPCRRRAGACPGSCMITPSSSSRRRRRRCRMLAGLGQLCLRIHARSLFGRPLDRDTGPASLHRQRHRVGEIVLALVAMQGQAREQIRQPRRVERHHPGIARRCPLQVRIGVAILDHRDQALARDLQSAIAGGIGRGACPAPPRPRPRPRVPERAAPASPRVSSGVSPNSTSTVPSGRQRPPAPP